MRSGLKNCVFHHFSPKRFCECWAKCFSLCKTLSKLNQHTQHRKAWENLCCDMEMFVLFRFIDKFLTLIWFISKRIKSNEWTNQTVMRMLEVFTRNFVLDTHNNKNEMVKHFQYLSLQCFNADEKKNFGEIEWNKSCYLWFLWATNSKLMNGKGKNKNKKTSKKVTKVPR